MISLLRYGYSALNKEGGEAMVSNFRLLSIPEAAKRYSLSKYTIRQWVKEERFTVIKAGRKVYINEERFKEFLGGNKNETHT